MLGGLFDAVDTQQRQSSLLPLLLILVYLYTYIYIMTIIVKLLLDF